MECLYRLNQSVRMAGPTTTGMARRMALCAVLAMTFVSLAAAAPVSVSHRVGRSNRRFEGSRAAAPPAPGCART